MVVSTNLLWKGHWNETQTFLLNEIWSNSNLEKQKNIEKQSSFILMLAVDCLRKSKSRIFIAQIIGIKLYGKDNHVIISSRAIVRVIYLVFLNYKSYFLRI